MSDLLINNSKTSFSQKLVLTVALKLALLAAAFIAIVACAPTQQHSSTIIAIGGATQPRLEPKSGNSADYVVVEGAPLAKVETPAQEKPSTSVPPSYPKGQCFDKEPLMFVISGVPVWTQELGYLSCLYPENTADQNVEIVAKRVEALRMKFANTNWDIVHPGQRYFAIAGTLG